MERIRVMRPNLHDVLGPFDSNIEGLEHFENEGETAARESLVQELTRQVSSRADELGCGQVIIPPDLISKVTQQVLRLADQEPCGVRGGVVHVHYHDGATTQHLATMVLDPTMPNTFELYLRLTPDTSSWYHKMARIIKPLRKSSPLLLSTDFVLEKRKLYPEE